MELAELREQIDGIDRDMVRLLARRFQLTEEVGRLKHREGLDPVNAARERRQFEKIDVLSSEEGLDAEFARRVLRLIIDEVVANHRRIAAGGAP